MFWRLKTAHSAPAMTTHQGESDPAFMWDRWREGHGNAPPRHSCCGGVFKRHGTSRCNTRGRTVAPGHLGGAGWMVVTVESSSTPESRDVGVIIWSLLRQRPTSLEPQRGPLTCPCVGHGGASGRCCSRRRSVFSCLSSISRASAS